MLDKISIKGAREHNLKNISLDLPRNKFIVITGISGSGKSTLAFDTLYAEGQRRYVESLSAYARQFLGLMKKPDVDSIEGLSPAISIEQKTTSKNPRSTVGTVTEIYDYLRLLYATIGIMECPKCGSAIKPRSVENITSLIMADIGKEILVLAPIIRGIKGNHTTVIEKLKTDGYSKVRIDGVVYAVDDALAQNLERYGKHWIEAVIDTITISDDERSRISEAIEQAVKVGAGRVITSDPKAKASKEIDRSSNETVYSTYGACPKHSEIQFEQLESRMFSFNSPFGACPACHGIGEKFEMSPDLIIPDKSKNIIDGAIKVYSKIDNSWRAQQLAAVGKKYGFDVFKPISSFTKKQLDVLLYGTSELINARWSSGASMNMENGFEGVIPQTMRLYKQTESDWRKEELEKYMVSIPCDTCKGKRLKDTVLAVKINSKSIIQITDMNIGLAVDFFESLPKSLSDKEKIISKQVLKEIRERLGFLKNVGLNYLSLSRSARTLSGGEAQRIRLATQIGSNLMGVLYILDEPSIGLHQRDNQKLIDTLHKLRDVGNTLIVVEHDEDTIRGADWVVDMGSGAGVHGGYICAQGTPKEIALGKSLTGEFLSGKRSIPTPNKRRTATGVIKLVGAEENNLKKVNVDFPLGVLCAITGVSGSGKSSLMNLTLMPAMKKHFGDSVMNVGKYKSLTVPESIKNVIMIDQDPIGKTPRSNPATYTKLFDEIRKVYAMTKQSKAKGYKEGRFSFNVSGGRCEACKGDGLIKIEMNFLPDVYVECDECKGKRYNKDTLAVLYKGKNIADVLDMSVEEALNYFENHPGIMRKIKTLSDVGLDYIKLGQAATTLSGGESQRIKLTRELAKLKRGDTLYLLDEPTTGLHFEDTRKLIGVLNRLVDKGNSVFVIEHNLDVIKCCDHVIDLGPEGGDAGGKILCIGTPEEICTVEGSYTGKFLKKMLLNKNTNDAKQKNTK